VLAAASAWCNTHITCRGRAPPYFEPAWIFPIQQCVAGRTLGGKSWWSTHTVRRFTEGREALSCRYRYHNQPSRRMLLAQNHHHFHYRDPRRQYIHTGQHDQSILRGSNNFQSHLWQILEHSGTTAPAPARTQKQGEGYRYPTLTWQMALLSRNPRPQPSESTR
jgi:hypothetical protein